MAQNHNEWTAEIELIISTSKRMAERMNGEFVIDPFKIHNFPTAESTERSDFYPVQSDKSLKKKAGSTTKDRLEPLLASG
ncbi:hypothetical protein [Microvirga sp. 2TAF3]|uniref:hypothetical protein n=1 Tax=Microvirga sp. 2TAF3 TaxID=3233014 RepID=UPI003F96A61A